MTRHYYGHTEYPLTGLMVEVTQQMTEPQFRRVGETIEQQLGRYKGWAEHYVFTIESTDPMQQLDRLTTYLRGEELSHVITFEQSWSA